MLFPSVIGQRWLNSKLTTRKFIISLLGIGRACSLALAKDGATVVVNYSRSQGPAEEVVSEINNLTLDDRDEATNGEAITIKADVSSISAIKQLVAEVVKKYGRIDILVCNAGKLYGNATLENTTEDTFDEAFNLNVKGVYFLIQVSYVESLSSPFVELTN